MGHVFPPDRFPYPDDAVLDRWRRTLAEPGVRVDVVDDPSGGLAAVTAYDVTTLRHLALHPDAWGRGLGRQAVDRAVASARAAGEPRVVLWCLRENHRARGLYEHLGWRETGVVRRAEWVPHPEELEYAVDTA
nr:GNAT family N-acetyltransferase [Nocardioides luti]